MEKTKKSLFGPMDLTKGTCWKTILIFSLPVILSYLLQQVYSISDAAIVGQTLTAQEVAGVNDTTSLVFIFLQFAFGVSAGFCVVTSCQVGARNQAGVRRSLATQIILSAALTGLLTALALALLNPMLAWINVTPDNAEVYQAAYTYCFIIFAGIGAQLFYNFICAFLRSMGDSLTPLLFLLFSTVLNVGLDPLLIFGLNMGVAGAALATILSQLASFCMLLLGCARGGNLRIRLKNVCFRRDLFLEIGKGGLPSLCRQGLASIATICLNRSAGLYGDAAIAAMSVVSRAMMLAQSALIGFGQGFQPVCGFNYGAGLYHRVKEGFRFCVKWSTVFLTAVSVLGLVLAPQIIAVFRNDPEVIAFGARALRLQCLAFPLCGVIVISSMLTPPINKIWQASELAVARQGLFFIPAVLALPHIWGELGVQLAQPVSDVCAFALTVPLVLGVLRDMDRQQRLEKIR